MAEDGGNRAPDRSPPSLIDDVLAGARVDANVAAFC